MCAILVGGILESVNLRSLDPAVNSAEFASLKPDKIREDELFMHTYFTRKTTLSEEAAKDKKTIKDDDESGSEMDFAG